MNFKKEQVKGDNPFNNRRNYVQLLQFHNDCGYIKSWVQRERGYQAQREYPEMIWAQRAKEPKGTYSIKEWKEHWKHINQVYLESLKGMKKSI